VQRKIGTFFFLKRAKKFLPYIDIGEANKMMASAKKQKKRWGRNPHPEREKEISLQAPPSS
jgi:hypothetical protein